MLTFREMVPDDLDAARRLWDAEPYLGITGSDSIERLRAYLERNRGLSFVAYDDDRLVGTVLAGHDERRSFVNHLCVEKEYRNKGVATKLCELCENALRGELPLRSYVMVYEDNARALEFWANHGYVRDDSLIIMKKDLGNR